MKKWVLLTLVMSVNNCLGDEVFKTILNPYTGRFDYVHNLASMTIGDLQSGIQILDEGTLQGGATWFNFVGAGVSVSVAGGTATITIAGGGGGGGGGAAIFDGTDNISYSTFSLDGFNWTHATGFSSGTLRGSTMTLSGAWNFTDSSTTFNSVIISSPDGKNFSFLTASTDGPHPVFDLRVSCWMANTSTNIVAGNGGFLIVGSTNQSNPAAISGFHDYLLRAGNLPRGPSVTNTNYTGASNIDYFFGTNNATTRMVLEGTLSSLELKAISGIVGFGSGDNSRVQILQNSAAAMTMDVDENTQWTGSIQNQGFALIGSSQVETGKLVAEGSATVKGIIVSTTGFQAGASTVAGNFMLEGGSIQVRNGSNEFTIAFATIPESAGQKIGVLAIDGTRVLLGGVGDSEGSADTSGLLSKADFIQHTTTAGTDNATSKAWFSTNSAVNDTQNSTISVVTRALTDGVLSSTTPYRSFSIPAAAWLGVMPASASWRNGGFVLRSSHTGAYNQFADDFHEFNSPFSTRTFVETSFDMPDSWDGSSIAWQVTWYASTGVAHQNVGWSLQGVSNSSGSFVYQTATTSSTVFSTNITSFTVVKSDPGSLNILGSPAPGAFVKLILSACGGQFDGMPRMKSVKIWYREAVWDGKPR